MNQNLPSSFHLVHSNSKKQRQVIAPKVLTCDWLTSPEAWEKEKFSNNIVEFIEQTQGLNAYPDLVLIGMLTHQIDCPSSNGLRQMG